jgi:hypothetical protein
VVAAISVSSADVPAAEMKKGFEAAATARSKAPAATAVSRPGKRTRSSGDFRHSGPSLRCRRVAITW